MCECPSIFSGGACVLLQPTKVNVTSKSVTWVTTGRSSKKIGRCLDRWPPETCGNQSTYFSPNCLPPTELETQEPTQSSSPSQVNPHHESTRITFRFFRSGRHGRRMRGISSFCACGAIVGAIVEIIVGAMGGALVGDVVAITLTTIHNPMRSWRRVSRQVQQYSAPPPCEG